MEGSIDTNSNLMKPTKFLDSAYQLVVSTALQLVQMNAKKELKTSEMEAVSTSASDSLPEINLGQVSWHDQPDDCWIVLYDRVYDITEFLREVKIKRFWHF